MEMFLPATKNLLNEKNHGNVIWMCLRSIEGKEEREKASGSLALLFECSGLAFLLCLDTFPGRADRSDLSSLMSYFYN